MDNDTSLTSFAKASGVKKLRVKKELLILEQKLKTHEDIIHGLRNQLQCLIMQTANVAERLLKWEKLQEKSGDAGDSLIGNLRSASDA